MDTNVVVLSGRLTRDLEINVVGEKKTSLGKSSLAFNSQFDRDHSNYIDFNMWGKRAEALQDYMLKGTQVILSGRLRQERWESEEGNRSKMVLEVESVTLIGGKRSEDDSSSNENTTATNSAAPSSTEPESVPF